MEILDRQLYSRLIDPLKQVRINNLFARSVVEKKVTGQVFVDNPENPKTFYVVHPYGMSLLFGDSRNAEFNNRFLSYSLNINNIRVKSEWMQAYPPEWDNVLSELYRNNIIRSEVYKESNDAEVIELNTRLNFTFNREVYRNKSELILPDGCEIIRTDETIYNKMTGSVIPSFFWDSADDFISNGVGFSLICDKKIAATAYSAFIIDDKLELGIETIPEFRGRGFAQMVCSALIDYCIEENYEPVWACRLENTGSCNLAAKLGFEVDKEVAYYRLGK